jgi:hypothetical protein
MGMSVQKPRFHCADCGVESPEAPENDPTPLISIKYGWRIRRHLSAEGRTVLEARCPACAATRGGSDARELAPRGDGKEPPKPPRSQKWYR